MIFKCLGDELSQLPEVLYQEQFLKPNLICSKGTGIPVSSERIGAGAKIKALLSVAKE